MIRNNGAKYTDIVEEPFRLTKKWAAHTLGDRECPEIDSLLETCMTLTDGSETDSISQDIKLRNRLKACIVCTPDFSQSTPLAVEFNHNLPTGVDIFVKHDRSDSIKTLDKSIHAKLTELQRDIRAFIPFWQNKARNTVFQNEAQVSDAMTSYFNVATNKAIADLKLQAAKTPDTVTLYSYLLETLTVLYLRGDAIDPEPKVYNEAIREFWQRQA